MTSNGSFNVNPYGLTASNSSLSLDLVIIFAIRSLPIQYEYQILRYGTQ